MFQSTHPRGVRPDLAGVLFPKAVVSIHAPAWGATPAQNSSASYSTGFNPRTRVGCDHSTINALSHVFKVSIHAPAWGATPKHRASGTVKLRVSIHAPAWGATASWLTGSANWAVSIHAPAWGATWCGVPANSCGTCFNPRTRVGCDWPLMSKARGPLRFQSTHPRGVRRGCRQRAGEGGGRFNPRTRVGCDLDS